MKLLAYITNQKTEIRGQRSVSILLPVFCLLFSVFCLLSETGSVRGNCPPADLNGDCRVDVGDLGVFAEQWLEPSGTCSGKSCADLDGEDGVNLADFALLSRNWLEAGVPLVINEVMASNTSSTRDPQGQYDDWIE
ncbi:MAG: dockerin type I domain-containing protein, partial [Planctomycetota bacterium]